MCSPHVELRIDIPYNQTVFSRAERQLPLVAITHVTGGSRPIRDLLWLPNHLNDLGAA
jgi:hypothetical protein